MQSTLVYSGNTQPRRPASKRVWPTFLISPFLTQRLSKLEGLNPAAITPFDCCSLSFQPFSHPVCARSADGTGTVFDLTNIIPWLKQVILS